MQAYEAPQTRQSVRGWPGARLLRDLRRADYGNPRDLHTLGGVQAHTQAQAG